MKECCHYPNSAKVTSFVSSKLNQLGVYHHFGFSIWISWWTTTLMNWTHWRTSLSENFGLSKHVGFILFSKVYVHCFVKMENYFIHETARTCVRMTAVHQGFSIGVRAIYLKKKRKKKLFYKIAYKVSDDFWVSFLFCLVDNRSAFHSINKFRLFNVSVSVKRKTLQLDVSWNCLFSFFFRFNFRFIDFSFHFPTTEIFSSSCSVFIDVSCSCTTYECTSPMWCPWCMS